MSAIKSFLTSQDLYGIQAMTMQEAVDCEMQALQTTLVQLCNHCWTDNNTAVGAPSQDWLDETRTQVEFCMRQLLEMQDARDCLNYDV